MKIRIKKKWLYLLAAIALLGIAVFCALHIKQHYEQVEEGNLAFFTLADTMRAEQSSGSGEESTDETGVRRDYLALYLQNEDIIGWLKIADTNIDYPVMQSADNPNYYLKHGFDKEYSYLGTPYIQQNCDIWESDNIILYSHNMKDGKMFGQLEQYKAFDFYSKHKTIQFDTLYEDGIYEIVCVFITTAYDEEGFRYYDFVKAQNEQEFDAFIQTCQLLSLYDTGVSAAYGDKLLTLSTCEYSRKNGRLAVLAKKIK